MPSGTGNKCNFDRRKEAKYGPEMTAKGLFGRKMEKMLYGVYLAILIS
jgi:hypothetical protein